MIRGKSTVFSHYIVVSLSLWTSELVGIFPNSRRRLKCNHWYDVGLRFIEKRPSGLDA